jgi:hypothetical protein
MKVETKIARIDHQNKMSNINIKAWFCDYTYWDLLASDLLLAVCKWVRN